MIYLIDPVPKPRMTQRDRWAQRPCVKRYWDFKEKVIDCGIELSDSPNIVFYMRMPKSWSKKKKAEFDGKPHKQRPDIDNLVKALFDSVFEEDSGVYSLIARKEWSYQGGIEIID